MADSTSHPLLDLLLRLISVQELVRQQFRPGLRPTPQSLAALAEDFTADYEVVDGYTRKAVSIRTPQPSTAAIAFDPGLAVATDDAGLRYRDSGFARFFTLNDDGAAVETLLHQQRLVAPASGKPSALDYEHHVRPGQGIKPAPRFDMLAGSAGRLLAKVEREDSFYFMALTPPDPDLAFSKLNVYHHVRSRMDDPTQKEIVGIPTHYTKNCLVRVPDGERSNPTREKFLERFKAARTPHLADYWRDHTFLHGLEFPLLIQIIESRVQAVEFTPNVWHWIDSRVAPDKAAPPDVIPSRKSMTYARTKGGILTVSSTEEAKVEQVLGLGVGHVFPFENWTPHAGGEIGCLDYVLHDPAMKELFHELLTQGRVENFFEDRWNKIGDNFTAFFQDIISGLTGFVPGGVDVIETAPRPRFARSQRPVNYRGVGSFIIQSVHGPMHDKDGYNDGTVNYYKLVSFVDEKTNHGPGKDAPWSFGLMFIDEQTAPTGRWRLAHPMDSEQFGDAKRGLRPLEDVMNLLFTKLANDEHFAGEQPRNFVDEKGTPLFRQGQFWCPFAVGVARRESALATAKQISAVTALEPFRPGTERDWVIYTVNCTYSTMDKTWRMRRLKDERGAAVRALVFPENRPGNWSAVVGEGRRDRTWASMDDARRVALQNDEPVADTVWLPQSLLLREDLTLMATGSRSVGGVVVDGYWYQRYLPYNAEMPAAPATAQAAPPEYADHPWKFMSTSAGLIAKKFQHFGVYREVESRTQAFLVKPVSGSLDELPMDARIAEGDVWRVAENSPDLSITLPKIHFEKLLDFALKAADLWHVLEFLDPLRALFVFAIESGALEPEHKYEPASRFNDHTRFRVLNRPHVGLVLVWADKRDDDLPDVKLPDGNVVLVNERTQAQITVDFAADFPGGPVVIPTGGASSESDPATLPVLQQSPRVLMKTQIRWPELHTPGVKHVRVETKVRQPQLPDSLGGGSFGTRRIEEIEVTVTTDSRVTHGEMLRDFWRLSIAYVNPKFEGLFMSHPGGAVTRVAEVSVVDRMEILESADDDPDGLTRFRLRISGDALLGGDHIEALSASGAVTFGTSIWFENIVEAPATPDSVEFVVRDLDQLVVLEGIVRPFPIPGGIDLGNLFPR
ncbi:MAG: hypothetical protein AAFV62_09120 [Pseudomonadota bacterium]